MKKIILFLAVLSLIFTLTLTGWELFTSSHACESVCSECGKCLDAECSESACADKCQGHKTPDEEPEHVCAESLTKTDAVAATCVADGCAEYYTCSCGKIYSDAEAKNETTVEDSVIKALGHDEISHDAKAPTCTEIGWDAYETCSRCDYTTYVEKSALDHDEVSHEAKAPTCTEIGWDAYETCSRCDYTTYVEKSALGHDEQSHDAKAPTCTEAGYDAYVTCSRCDYTTYAEKVALGHDEQSHDAKAPTCTEGGYDAYVTCSRCDYTTYVEKSALDHDTVSHNAQAPTCTEKGWEAYVTCSRCDYNTKVEKEVIDHNYEWIVDLQPTVNATGLKHEECTMCHDKRNENTTIDKITCTHEMIKTEAVTATCLTAGNKEYYTCSICNKVYSNAEGTLETTVENSVIAALGHDEQSHNAQAPTCTEIGWDAYVTCSRCDYTTYAEKTALGHDEISHDAKAPTCTEGGYDAYVTCSRCDYTTYADKEALGHDEQSHDAKAPTCTEIGWDAYETCSRCDYTTYSELSAKGHRFSKVNTISATCTVDGYVEITCGNCNEMFDSREDDEAKQYLIDNPYFNLAAKGHKYESVVTAPTCEAKGYTTYTCSCGDSYVADYVDALGHTLVECSVVTTPTYEVEGEISATCSTCASPQTINIGTLSVDNGYTLVITGVLSRWTYTIDGATFTFDIKENVKVTDYLYECDAFYLSYIDGVMTTQDGYKTTNNTDFNGSRFGSGTNKTYTTTITVSEATTVTLYVELARSSSTRYYSNTISSVSVNGKTADVIPTEDSFVFKGWSSYKYYAVATIFLDAGTNVVHFKTITNANTAGVGFGSTIPIHMHTDVIDPAVAATCDAPGKTQGIHCSDCGEIVISQELIPNRTEWELKELPSFDATGTLERTCTVCGEAETVIMPLVSVENGYTIIESQDKFYKAEYTYEGKTFLLDNSVYVTFDYNGAGESITEKTLHNSKLSQPTTPTYSYTDYAGKQYNFVFVGWYLDGVLYDFNTILTSDITLVARWELPEEFFAFEENADVRASGTDLRIMSFNVLADDWNDKPAVAPRVDHFVNTLNRYLPDVVCMQEFDDQWYEAFMALTDFKYKLVTVDGNGKVLVNESTNYVTIAYNTETVELIEFEQGKLPTGSNKSVRNVTSAIFNIKATNERCIVMSVHFNTSESQIENNGHEILEFISDLKTRYPDYPIVLAGDFNTPEGSVAYNTIINGSGFTDTKTADKLGLVMDTYHKGNGFDSTTTLGRDSILPKKVMTTASIDHIFTDNNIHVLYFDTVCDDDALKASDHLPTYCDISFKNEQPKSYTYTVEDGLFTSVTDGGAYAEGTVVGINTNKYGTFYEHTKGATFTLDVVVAEDTEVTFVIKGCSTNGYSFNYSDVIKSLTLNGEAVETNDYTLKTFGWYAERANGIVIAKLSLKAGSNTISFTMGTETAKDINIAAVTFVSDSLVSIAKD